MKKIFKAAKQQAKAMLEPFEDKCKKKKVRCPKGRKNHYLYYFSLTKDDWKRHDTLKTKELLSVSNPRSIEAHQIGSCVRSFAIFFLHFCRFNHRFFRLFVRQFTSSALLRFDSQLQRHFFSQISFKTRIEFGSPGEAICEVARDEQVTCILLGNRGLGAFRRRILGSVSDHVVHHSKIPVIIVPPKGP